MFRPVSRLVRPPILSLVLHVPWEVRPEDEARENERQQRRHRRHRAVVPNQNGAKIFEQTQGVPSPIEIFDPKISIDVGKNRCL